MWLCDQLTSRPNTLPPFPCLNYFGIVVGISQGVSVFPATHFYLGKWHLHREGGWPTSIRKTIPFSSFSLYSYIPERILRPESNTLLEHPESRIWHSCWGTQERSRAVFPSGSRDGKRALQASKYLHVSIFTALHFSLVSFRLRWSIMDLVMAVGARVLWKSSRPQPLCLGAFGSFF